MHSNDPDQSKLNKTLFRKPVQIDLDPNYILLTANLKLKYFFLILNYNIEFHIWLKMRVMKHHKGMCMCRDLPSLQGISLPLHNIVKGNKHFPYFAPDRSSFSCPPPCLSFYWIIQLLYRLSWPLLDKVIFPSICLHLVFLIRFKSAGYTSEPRIMMLQICILAKWCSLCCTHIPQITELLTKV